MVGTWVTEDKWDRMEAELPRENTWIKLTCQEGTQEGKIIGGDFNARIEEEGRSEKASTISKAKRNSQDKTKNGGGESGDQQIYVKIIGTARIEDNEDAQNKWMTDWSTRGAKKYRENIAGMRYKETEDIDKMTGELIETVYRSNRRDREQRETQGKPRSNWEKKRRRFYERNGYFSEEVEIKRGQGQSVVEKPEALPEELDGFTGIRFACARYLVATIALTVTSL
ncbi:hypothetical protein CBL_01722 [Carabus blaptoides fortunei]